MNPQPPMNTETQFLYDLVSASSVSGNESQAAQVFMQHASQLGMTAHIDQVGNAIAHRGPSAEDAEIHIVMLGHIDTVAGNIPVRIEDGILHGRGSVDAKGPLAAMLIASSRADIPKGVRLTVAGAVGEEAAGSIGARHLVTQWHPDACIIGEPSSKNGVTLGYKGRLLCTATAVCPNTHSAGKDPSACDQISTWWQAVQNYTDLFNSDRVGIFDQLQATIEAMNSSNNGFEQHATLNAGFRLPTAMEPDTFTSVLESLTNDCVSLQFQGAEHAYATNRNDPVVRALSVAIRTVLGTTPRPKLKTGTADLNVVAPIWKCPIAAYGPGDSDLDHTPIEHLHLDEYQSSIEVLTNAIGSLANELLTNGSITN